MRTRRAALALGLVALVAFAFAGALSNGFVAYDDDDYVTANPLVLGGLTLEGVGSAFTDFRAGNWHPLTWLSHMADVELFGLDPRAHHAVNVAWHAGNALLVFWLLGSLTGTTWRALLVAALFALHPLRVESVAWVAERKDLLSSCFGLLALIAWTRFARSGAPGARGLALLCYALSLLAKPMLVTLPFLLLLLDFWPLERLRSRADLWPRVREKLFLVALALGSSLVTLAAQASAIQPLPLGLRLTNAVSAYSAYLRQTFWPEPLAVIYPYRAELPAGELVLSLALVAGLSALAVWQARRRPWLFVGWFWFAGLLVPTIGLVQVGVQAHADRYTYLPSLGIALMLSWALAEGVARARRRPRLARGAAVAATLVALALLVARTREQVEVWRDTETLFAHATSVTRANWYAHANLGVELASRGELERARAELESALRFYPRFARALAHLGRVNALSGDGELGIRQLREALAIDPRLRGGALALGRALEPTGQFAEAAAAYRAALALDPEDRAAALQLARILAIAPDASLRDGREAVALCERACGARGCETAEALDILAMAYMEAGRGGDALAASQRALDLALARGDAALAARIVQRRKAYARGEPVRARVPMPSPGG